MEAILHIDLISIIKTIGYLGLCIIIFAESGLFFGFFLPGDSLLIAAGLLASQDFFNIFILCATLGLAAIFGDSVGYWFGKKVGPKIFEREDSRFFHKKHLERTKAFYKKHGSKAVVIGRFVPIIRTFVPILAGVGTMEYKKFIRFNILGAVLWSIGVTLLGYFLGTAIPNIDKYILPIVLVIIFFSVLPIVFELRKAS